MVGLFMLRFWFEDWRFCFAFGSIPIVVLPEGAMLLQFSSSKDQ